VGTSAEGVTDASAGVGQGLVSPTTLAALRADYTDADPTREAPDPRLVELLDSYERLAAELTELRALQADQQRAFAAGLEAATAPIAPLRALRDAVAALLPDLRSSEDGACTVCGEPESCADDCTAPAVRQALAAVSPCRVPGRPAGQRIADDPTPEAREILGMVPRE
jgi:hypothetical protein